VLVLQSGTLAADLLVPLVAELVAAGLPFPLVAAVERSQAAVRRFEGLEPREGVLSGALPGELWVRDGALWHLVDVRAGHKTGHYLDMRDNRRRAAARAADRRVLDAFCYDGLFGIHAALAGAREVVCIDQSREAGERLARNAERNDVADRVRFERADCMHALRDRERAGERFGLVVVDPPPFARNRRELAGAQRGYVELNRRAFGVCADGALLVSASCSSNVRPELFVEFLRTAAARAGREAVVEELAGAAPDHPELLALPESRYLACAFLRVGPERSGGGEGPVESGPATDQEGVR
jgi:23S rRNA (cytosine1962-C5)-methyltransferase